MIKEIWENIPGYEGHYQVSSLGRIKSLKWGNVKFKNTPITKNYRCVKLRKDGKEKFFGVHQLMGMAFLNHVPNGWNLVIDHIDGNKLNNNIDNLRVVTTRENNIFWIQNKKENNNE